MSATTKVRVNINGTSTDYRLPTGVRTATQLAANAQFREDFSLGSNITVLVNGAEYAGSIGTNDLITVQVNAARKAAARTRVRVNINGTSEDYFLPAGVRTASQLAASSQFREDFGLGTNITVLVNGVESAGSIGTNDVITVSTNASRKAW